MLRYAPFLVGLLPAEAAFAQTPIAAARDLPLGTTVTVRGIVLNGSELGSIRYVQDATAGIAAFPGSGSAAGFSPPRGADVSVTGPLKLFNGLLEIDPVQSFTVHSTGNALPAAQPVTPAILGELHESELVRMAGCAFANGGGTFASGTSPYTCNGESGVVYLRNNHPLVGTAIPAGAVDLTGIVSQYSTANPPVGGYQLLLRNAADIAPSGAIVITGPVSQENILPGGFTLRFNTNVAATGGVRFGTTPAYGSVVTVPGLATAHSVALTGLQPATTYHARAFAVLGNDTAWAPPGLYSTASALPGGILVYFNEPVDHGVATGPLAVDLGSAFDDTLRAYMDRAQLTLDVAMYNTTNNSLVTAANDARARGVQVRWIAEGSQSNSALGNLHPSIPVLYRANSPGSGMHNKFLVIDADLGPWAHVLTGSANFTNASFFQDANNLVVVRDMALARAYRREFEEMWGSTGALPNPANSRFGAAKLDDTPHLFNVNGTLVECRFSPSDGTTARIDAHLHAAQQRVEFALFSLTSGTLTDALIDAEARPGVTVRGILEGDGLNTWTFNDLQAGGVNVLTDNMPGTLHHKYAIIDRGLAGAVTITGSHNWSFNAETHNDENTLFIHGPAVANLFYQEWSGRWTNAVGLPEGAEPEDALHLWPNPAADILHIRWGGEPGTWVRVSDPTGREVLRERITGPLHALPLHGLPGGSYLLSAEGGGRRAARRFVRLP